MWLPTSTNPTGAGAVRSWAQRLILGAGIAVSTIFLAASGFAVFLAARVSGVEKVELAGIVEVAADQPQNWLVVGSDAGRGDAPGNRTDTIMIVRVDPAGTHLDILSLHRDLWVPIAGTRRHDKINSAYGDNDTPSRLIDTIKLNFDIDINHYVEIGFDMFKSIVDAVGGVPLYFDRAYRDQSSGLDILTTGCVTLNGDQALSFARSRKLETSTGGGRWVDANDNDSGRISRQQILMKRMFGRARAKAANPMVLTDFVNAANTNIKLDSKVDLDQAAAMLQRFSSFDPNAIKTWSLPVVDLEIAGVAALGYVQKDAVPMLNVFRGLDEHDADPRMVGLAVANGTGTTGQAADVAEAYRAIGYQAEADLSPAGPVTRTQVRHGSAAAAIAAQVERHLTAGAEIVADPAMDADKVVIVTGPDLTTVMRRPRPYEPPPPAPPPEPTTSVRGGRSTTTTTGAAPTHNDGDSMVGMVPGQAPPGVDCS